MPDYNNRIHELIEEEKCKKTSILWREGGEKGLGEGGAY